MTKKPLLQNTCPVLGVKMDFENPKSPYIPSLDRIDNRLGYSDDNVRIISFRANNIKKDATPAEIELLYADSVRLAEWAVNIDPME